jgi:hypothetical protein
VTATLSGSACEDPQRRTRPLPVVGQFVVSSSRASGPCSTNGRRSPSRSLHHCSGMKTVGNAGFAGKRCSRLASQQHRQDVAFEPLRPTSSGWLEARLNQESATCLYGRFGIDRINPRTHMHPRVAGVVHEPTVGVVPAAGQHRALPSWLRPMTTVSLSGRHLTHDPLA